MYKLEDTCGYLHDICLKEFKYAFLSGRKDGIASSMQEIAQNPQFIAHGGQSLPMYTANGCKDCDLSWGFISRR